MAYFFPKMNDSSIRLKSYGNIKAEFELILKMASCQLRNVDGAVPDSREVAVLGADQASSLIRELIEMITNAYHAVPTACDGNYIGKRVPRSFPYFSNSLALNLEIESLDLPLSLYFVHAGGSWFFTEFSGYVV